MTVERLLKLLERVEHKESEVYFRTKDDIIEVEFVAIEHELKLNEKEDRIVIILEGEA